MNLKSVVIWPNSIIPAIFTILARSAYAFEHWGGEAFVVRWEGNKLALFCQSNGCYVSASSDGQLLADCSLSPGNIILSWLPSCVKRSSRTERAFFS